MAATVLLVEDERKLRELVRSYLERAGFTALSTGSGAEAITLAASAAPDLVVLDLGLPDVPGETVAREVRAGGPVPIVMLTAKAAEEDRIAGLELGADDYVTKPFSPRELVLRVQLQAVQPAGAGAARPGHPAPRPAVGRAGGGQLRRRDPARRRVAPRGDGAQSASGPDPDRVGHPGRAGHRPGPGVLALRADQPGPRV